jgi:hypothetical protein
MRELVKLPVPVPSVDLLFAIVGPADVFQQTPLAMMEVLPIEEIVPPPEAELAMIKVIGVVDIVGANPSVLNDA